jgi:integrase
VGRTVKDASLGTPAARAKLQVRPKPYYRSVQPGLHLGYAKRVRGKPGVWLARYYLGDEKYEVEGFTYKVAHGDVACTADDQQPADGTAVLSFGQALDRARQRYAERASAAAGGLATVAAALDAYFDWLEAHKKSSRPTEARGRAQSTIYPVLGDIELDELTTDDVEEWLFTLASKRNGDDEEAVRRRQATANRTLTILRAALNKAYRDKKVASDGEWRRVKPFKGVAKARVRFLTVDECRRFLAACSAEFRPLAQAALTTGCRCGELVRLTVDDFKPASGTLHVRQSKSGKPRHVVLNDEGAAFFAALCAGRPGHELMLLRTSAQPWRRNGQQPPMAQACRRAGITPPATFHALRHTWASLSVMAGMPLVVVAKNLGHTSTKMVEAHYGHLSKDFVAQAIHKSAPTFGFAS